MVCTSLLARMLLKWALHERMLVAVGLKKPGTTPLPPLDEDAHDAHPLSS
jgi:hypothetical protein